MIEIGEFVDARGGSPFGRWVSRLDHHATARVATALYRMEAGNLSNAKAVAAEYWSTESTSAQATGSTSDGTVMR